MLLGEGEELVGLGIVRRALEEPVRTIAANAGAADLRTHPGVDEEPGAGHLGRLGTAVRVQEVGVGPAVLFVHGGAASGANWAPLVAELDGYRCVLLDRPGCGLSEPTSADLTRLDRFGRFAGDLVTDVLDGLDERGARERDGDAVRVVSWHFEENDRARAERATSSAIATLLRLQRLTWNGVSWPCSFRRPKCSTIVCARAMDSAISTSRCCTSCFLAMGTPNAMRSREYDSAASKACMPTGSLKSARRPPVV